MSADSLYGVDEWVILLALFALLLAAAEAGFRFGRYAESSTGETTKQQIAVVPAAILGILGLLLAFTVSMAVSRFEVRKQLVLAEANAVGTSYLRTQLLPAPQSTELASLLREYVDLRLQYGDPGVRTDQSRDEAVRNQAVRLQGKFWSLAVAYARQESNPTGAGLLLQSLNQAIELEAARWMALRNRVPETVIYVDAIVALLAVSLLGYVSGAGGRRHVFAIGVLALAITAVVGVIIDLDQPGHGFIRVSQQPMIDLQHQLETRK